MTTLLIMRHAKSDWSKNVDDFDRPINKRGIKAARKMGSWLKKENYNPDLIVSSPAQRARQTMEIVCEELGRNTRDIVWDQRIYLAELDELLQVISEHGKNTGCLLIAGHNPGLDELVGFLSKNRPQLNTGGKLMTTAAVAILRYDSNEVRAGEHTAELKQIVRPKEI